MHHIGRTADVVVNCTGLGAASLEGVRDTSVVPVRGQTILVNSDPESMIGVSGSEEGAEELTYVMKRAGGKVSRS
jgi:D-amino-acid oxidase